MSSEDNQPIELNANELRQKINLETGQISWAELQRYFAKGVVIAIDNTLDLVETAAKFAEDDQNKVKAWLEQGQVFQLDDDTARQWAADQPDFWAVVVMPWVLVQKQQQNGETDD